MGHEVRAVGVKYASTCACDGVMARATCIAHTASNGAKLSVDAVRRHGIFQCLRKKCS